MPFKITFNGKEGQKGSFQSPDNKDVIISLKAGESVTTEKDPGELPKKFFTVEGGTIRKTKEEGQAEKKEVEKEEAELPVKEAEEEKEEPSEEEEEKPKEDVKSKKTSKKKKKKGDK